MSSSSKILCFLLAHHEFLVNHLSGIYPLTIHLIEKYKNHWNWDSLTGNENLPWSTGLFFQFEDYWSWRVPNEHYSPDIQSNPYFPLSPELIRKHEDKIDWEGISQDTSFLLKYPQLLDEYKDRLFWDYISGNEELNWSEELIKKFEDKWHWKYLSGNKAIKWLSGLIHKYMDKVDIGRILYGNDEPWLNTVRPPFVDSSKPLIKIPGESVYTREEFELILDEGNWYRMSWEKRIPWSEELIGQYRDFWDWEELSKNRSLPWTFELIDHFKEYWNFSELSSNDALPWSEDLIEAFPDRWEWGKILPEDELDVLIPGLSGNFGLPFSIDLVNKYQLNWCWVNLAYNEGIPWSLDWLIAFEDFWNFGNLSGNEVLWKTIFYPHLNDQTINELMSQIVKKKQK